MGLPIGARSIDESWPATLSVISRCPMRRDSPSPLHPLCAVAFLLLTAVVLPITAKIVDEDEPSDALSSVEAYSDEDIYVQIEKIDDPEEHRLHGNDAFLEQIRRRMLNTSDAALKDLFRTAQMFCCFLGITFVVFVLLPFTCAKCVSGVRKHEEHNFPVYV